MTSPKEEKKPMCSHYLTPQGGCHCKCHGSVSIKDAHVCQVCYSTKKKEEKTFTLDQIPKESTIRATVTDSKGNKIGDHVIFHRLDGMYSYCTVEDSKDAEGREIACHLSRFTPLKLDESGVYHLT